MAEFLGDQFGGVSVDNIVATQHFTLIDHEFHDVSDAFVHPACKILQGDGFRQGNLDRDFLALFTPAEAAFAFAFAGTADRCQRALAVCIVTQGRRDRQLATAACARVACCAGGGFA